MSTPESKVKQKVKEILKKHGAYWHMPVQTGYGAPALDFHVCFKGHYLGIETKAPGKKPTPRQELIIDDIKEAGGKTLVIDGTNYEDLTSWMKTVSGDSQG